MEEELKKYIVSPLGAEDPSDWLILATDRDIKLLNLFIERMDLHDIRIDSLDNDEIFEKIS